jgi:predicted DNA-binding protein (UPF0278 family)
MIPYWVYRSGQAGGAHHGRPERPCEEAEPMKRRGASARIVRYVVEASGHVEVLIPHTLYRKVLLFMRRHHVEATPDEVVADALRAYIRSPQSGRIRS